MPVFRRGHHVRTELRRNDKLAIAILRQAGADHDRLRHAAQLRWRGKQERAALAAAQAATRGAAEAKAADDNAALQQAVRTRFRVPPISQL